jgi:bifunctional non-homologous end joining protein LigD
MISSSTLLRWWCFWSTRLGENSDEHYRPSQSLADVRPIHAARRMRGADVTLHRATKYGIGPAMEWSTPHRPSLLPVGFVEPCLPSVSATAPRGQEWVHEIKHDGYRMIVRRDGKRARVFTRRGFDWTGRFRWIEDALLSLRIQSATIDGEAVWCGEDGVSVFEKLHSRAYDYQVFLYAFDLLELDGEDCRREPLEKRKAALAGLLAERTGVRLSEHMEGDGPIIFEHACKMGLEGIVSQRRDLPYRSGRVRSWIKVKNPASPAVLRIVEEGAW